MPAKVVLNVTPDRLDLRDRPYLPAVALAPPPALALGKRPPPMDQGESSACTGFALAAVIDHLLARSGRAKDAGVSPWMLYSMARRYDEFPGVAEDAGSSLRGALKGWFKHGACGDKLWPGLAMPRTAKAPGEEWWLDAVNRPLGAYYRVDMRSVTDMHVALNEVGALYASALTHAGWFDVDKRASLIPARPRKASDGGHAFAIVGYDQRGFLVRNSWGAAWGDGGYATLTYEDWLENAMDCWVAQLGVVTEAHRRVAAQLLPENAAGAAALSSDRILQNHQLAPYVIDMENDGQLSRSGTFRTSADDVRSLAHDYLGAARTQWKIPKGKPVDIAVYAHGGLTSEAEAAATFARWMPALYEARKFPVFLMWESDLWSTLQHAFEDAVRQPPAAGPLESLSRWWNERLEGLLAPAGTALWDEMKENAAAISAGTGSGGRQFFDALRASPVARDHPLRLHLVGHSAGAIALAYLVDRLAAQEWEFESVTFMAPAITVERFQERLLPWLESRHVRRYHQYHLTDPAELSDSTMRPVLGYGRSLLYLVSRSFEGHGEAPILGMERHFPAALARRRNVKVVVAPAPGSAVTTHGGFDDDATTMRSVIASMSERL
jgi:hypothetical protein